MRSKLLMVAGLALTSLLAFGTAGATEAPYKVNADGKVDGNTRKGFETWRSAACERCHGAKQEGMVGPSLIESLKKLSKDEFKGVVLTGRAEKGMPPHPALEPKIDWLYAYLKCRSDGACKEVKVFAAE